MPAPPSPRLSIQRIPFNSPATSRLVAALDVEQEQLHPDWARYPYAGPGNWLVGDPSTNVPGAVGGEHVHTLAAYVHQDDEESGRAVGCIGLKVLESEEPGERTAQVKRLYVEPEYRGRLEGMGVDRSVAQMLIEAVEKLAGDLGVHRLLVETGMNQVPALKFYGRNGYTRCADFGEFVGAGEEVGGLSRCFEKRLVD